MTSLKEKQVGELLDEEEIAASNMIYSLIKRTEYEKQNSLTWQMNLTITTTQILQKYGGFYYDSNSGKVIRIKQGATLNATGTLRLGVILDTYLNKDIISGNITNRDKYDILIDFVQDFYTEFYAYRKRYGLEWAQYFMVCDSIMHSVNIALSRAVGDGTRKWQQPFLKLTESSTQNKDKEENNNLLK